MATNHHLLCTPTPTLPGLPLELVWTLAERHLPPPSAAALRRTCRALSPLPLNRIYPLHRAKHALEVAKRDPHAWSEYARDVVLAVPGHKLVKTRLIDDALIAAVHNYDADAVDRLLSLTDRPGYRTTTTKDSKEPPAICAPLRGATKTFGHALAGVLHVRPFPSQLVHIACTLALRAPCELAVALAQHHAYRQVSTLRSALHTMRECLHAGNHAVAPADRSACPPYSRHAHLAVAAIMGDHEEVRRQAAAKDIRHASAGTAAFAAALAVASAAVFDDARVLAGLQVSGVVVPLPEEPAVEATVAGEEVGDVMAFDGASDYDDDAMSDTDSAVAMLTPVAEPAAPPAWPVLPAFGAFAAPAPSFHGLAAPAFFGVPAFPMLALLDAPAPIAMPIHVTTTHAPHTAVPAPALATPSGLLSTSHAPQTLHPWRRVRSARALVAHVAGELVAESAAAAAGELVARLPLQARSHAQVLRLRRGAGKMWAAADVQPKVSARVARALLDSGVFAH